MLVLDALGPLDWLALALFLASWAGFTLFADWSRWHAQSVAAAMAKYRRLWLLAMLERDNRMLDAGIMSNLLNGAAFFGSTALLAIGALAAGLGAADTAVDVLSDLPLAGEVTPALWEAKVLVLLLIFVYAFFKFAWAYRLFSYCAVLIGTAPVDPADSQGRPAALRAARINTIGARHFNHGQRSFYFALAALAWFIHALLFMAATLWVLNILHRREFRSETRRVLHAEAEALLADEEGRKPL